MSGEAPDIREQEDCPSGEACDWSCDLHPGFWRAQPKWEAEGRYAALVDKVRALAELGVREQWPSDEWAAGLRTLLEADQ